MLKNRLAWMIGGPQGSGINFIAETFARACLRAGLYVFANIEYHSNIKGKHSYYRVRVDTEEIHSHLDQVDLLVALDKETIFGDIGWKEPSHHGHRHEVTPGGGIVYDSELGITPEQIGRPDVKLYPVPYKRLLAEALKEFGKERELSAYQVMVNMVAFGASMGVIGFDFEAIAEGIRAGFTGRRARLSEMNIGAARHAYDYTREKFGDSFGIVLERLPYDGKRVLLRGSYAIAIAKLKAGCGFHAYYPITPATDESTYLESKQRDYPMIIVQTEDEIAAITMAIGAAHAGLRASTSTSGPGFSLMVEGLGWAGMTEVPGLVVVHYQRAGPSTGLATRNEQGDLRFVLHASHGEFPRIVIAPGDPVECFYDTFDAFNYADRYQMPVVVLTDRHLAGSYMTAPFFNGDGLRVDRGLVLTDDELAGMNDYERYRLTELGVSPRTVLGTRSGIFWVTGSEHDERGHPTESHENRTRMMQKRMRKLLLADSEIPEGKKASLYGSRDAEIVIVSWGSTKGAILDAMKQLHDVGYSLNFLQVRYMSPFPKKLVEQVLGAARKKIIIEANYSAQLAGLIREYTGIGMDHKILKYNGRPFSQNEVYDAVMEVLNGGAEEVVMNRA